MEIKSIITIVLSEDENKKRKSVTCHNATDGALKRAITSVINLYLNHYDLGKLADVAEKVNADIERWLEAKVENARDSSSEPTGSDVENARDSVKE